MGAKSIVVTLVRGTRVFPWEALQADWTLEQLPLCLRLAEDLNCAIRVFSWKEKNSFVARGQAA